MKKNLYDIMNEAEAKELEPLLENLQSENPEGISAENIAAKVANKRKKARAKARTLWVRIGAAAACLALIIGVMPFLGGGKVGIIPTIATGPSNAQPEMGTAIIPSLGYADSISFMYYFPLKDGMCLAEEITHKLDKGKLYMTWKDHLAIFFEHCELDVTVTNWETDTIGASTQTSPDGKLVTHTFGTTTLYLYFEGEDVLDDHTLKCLVNTIDSITYANYIKLYYNGEPVAIEGKCPEKGFVNFSLNTVK